MLPFSAERGKWYTQPSLDRKVHRVGKSLPSTCNMQPTDTRLIMNFHSISPLTNVKVILDNNQCPKSFWSLSIYNFVKDHRKTERTDEEEETSHKLFIQDRGQHPEDYVKALKSINAPHKLILTPREMKMSSPLDVEKALVSGVVYQIRCSSSSACYVGQHIEIWRPASWSTSNHLNHSASTVQLSFDNKDSVCFIQSTANSITFLILL